MHEVSRCPNHQDDKVKVSINGPSFSHAFFADDLMLFVKANAKNCEVILEVLNNFCNLAGQKVNHGKSKIFFSLNVTRRRKRSVCRRLGINAINNLGKYLGFPIIHQGRVSSAFNFVIEKVQSQLVGWKTKLLSRARKLVLAKTVAAPIAKYSLQQNVFSVIKKFVTKSLVFCH